jgi:hypothetical protein
MDYTIVTAWYDVREKENHPDKDNTSNSFFCSMDWYFDSAKLLFHKPFPMVIFTEPRFKDLILSARPAEYHSITHFIFRDYEELENYNLFQTYEQNHLKNKIHNLSPEKFTALYKFIVNQKVCFMKDVILMNPFETSRFAWMDLRLHCVYDMSVDETTEVMKNIPETRVKLMQMSTTTPYDIYTRHDFYSWTRGKCAAGFFGGCREPMLTFCRLCIDEFKEAISQEMAPTDEMVYSSIIAYHPDLFDPYVGEYCDCLRNLLHPRGSHHLVFSFLQKAFENNMYDYMITITRALRTAYVSNVIDITPDPLNRIWYYSYLAHYRKNEREMCRYILKEYYEIAHKRKDVADYITTNTEFLNCMIGFEKENIIS